MLLQGYAGPCDAFFYANRLTPKDKMDIERRCNVSSTCLYRRGKKESVQSFFVEVCWPCISEDVGQQALRLRNMRFFTYRMDMEKSLFMTGGFHQ